MFGSKGPSSRRGGRPPAPGETAKRGGDVTETMIVQGGRRPSPAADRPRPARERRAAVAVVAPPRLVDLAADWLSTVLALAQAHELPDARALRARALELKERFEREAAQQGFASADVEDAVFAMVAFTDQTVLNSAGGARATWIASPLELELYGRQLAGNEFFERLDLLRQAGESRVEALEVYACCLAFGFTGRYRLTPDRLPALVEEVQRDAEAARGRATLPLAPNAGRRFERVSEERGGMPWWMPPLGFLAATLLAYLLVWLVSALGARGIASAIQRLGGA
jgi:type VI secretion system protein ImpK